MGLHLSGHNKDEANKDLDSFQSGKKQLTGKELVAEKLTKMYGKQLSNEDLDKFATILSDVEKLKKVYLHTDFQQAQQLQKSISDMKLKGDEEDDDGGNLQIVDTKFDPFADMKNHIRIKLVVSETSRNVLEKNMKRLVCPFVSFDHFKAPFGFMHIALCIGAWRLEWNTSELCIPRTVQGNASLLAADIESIATLDRLDVVRDQIAKCIVRWNTTMLYKQNGGEIITDEHASGNVGYGNCQQFIDDCMNALGLDTSAFPLPLKKYIQKLRTNGYGKMEFNMDDDFHKRFFHSSSSGRARSSSTISAHTPTTTNSSLASTPQDLASDLKRDDDQSDDDESTNATIGTHVHLDDNQRSDAFDPSKYAKKKRITFKTHAQLDQFMHYLMKVEPEFQFQYKYEYYLLKAFDRALWMRALATNFENPMFTPCVDEFQVHTCPFGDPRDTSILALNLKKI